MDEDDKGMRSEIFLVFFLLFYLVSYLGFFENGVFGFLIFCFFLEELGFCLFFWFLGSDEVVKI